MNIVHFCPSKLATGGTEGIHHLVSELNKCGANAKILYVGSSDDPQPKEYSEYNCPFITELPKDYEGTVIFPEVWGNNVIEPRYRGMTTVINWQGIDVYYWNNPVNTQKKFLQNKSTIHVTMSEYGMEHLRGLGLNPLKIPDCINNDFLQDFTEEYDRSNTVLYNPVPVKMTNFQETVMARCVTELGIKFKPIKGYTKLDLIDLFRHSKLYIDFGVFSGRERLPREAVMCGCCILTSNKGTAKAYLDNAIPDKYKIEDVDTAIQMIRYILKNYEVCKSDYVDYQRLMHKDKEEYHAQVEELYHAILNNNPSP